MLEVPKDDLQTFRKYYEADHLLKKHFNVARYFWIYDRVQMKEKVENGNDFLVNLVRSDQAKVWWLQRFQEMVENVDKNVIDSKKTLTQEESDTCNEEYFNMFPTKKAKEYDLTQKKDVDALQGKIYHHLFGDGFTIGKQVRYKEKRGYTYEVVPEILKEHKTLLGFRRPELFKDFGLFNGEYQFIDEEASEDEKKSRKRVELWDDLVSTVRTRIEATTGNWPFKVKFTRRGKVYLMD
ncbi:hypothetical protein CYMTET_54680 [Cymbomonas tetramitiformis]|uniref:Uncharacterized protein n=1 Tax=Cymbomonas tetramitiformis TaxID=36881 RepID=A0AAE0EP38_9CHLO|nr:hypothetical protein CYMTET_54680 [Cymbomonas tetramitiformis]